MTLARLLVVWTVIILLDSQANECQYETADWNPDHRRLHSSWTALPDSLFCIQKSLSSKIKPLESFSHVNDADACMSACEEEAKCIAIDYNPGNSRCDLFIRVCNKSLTKREGVLSYFLDRTKGEFKDDGVHQCSAERVVVVVVIFRSA